MKRARGPAAEPEKRRLPEAGLAEELLASWQDGAAAPPAPAMDGAPAVPGAARLYELADRLTSRRADERDTPREQPETWVTLEAAGEVFALPVDRVEEVMRAPEITRLPYAPAAVRGITQQRGRVLTVVDLRVRLGFAPAAIDARSRICVVTSRGRSLGLLVDAALNVSKLLPSGKQPAPPEVMTEKSRFIIGVYRLNDALAILLDLDRVLLLDEDAAPREEEIP